MIVSVEMNKKEYKKFCLKQLFNWLLIYMYLVNGIIICLSAMSFDGYSGRSIQCLLFSFLLDAVNSWIKLHYYICIYSCLCTLSLHLFSVECALPLKTIVFLTWCSTSIKYILTWKRLTQLYSFLYLCVYICLFRHVYVDFILFTCNFLCFDIASSGYNGCMKNHMICTSIS